jgi:O-antigen/teichoic acid export membrane protein
VYIAFNKSFINLWIGPGVYGGDLLTSLFAAQFIIVGDTFLLNQLYRGTDAVKKGAWILALEAILRVFFMMVGIHYFAQLGVPIANSVISIIFGFILWKLLCHRLHSQVDVGPFFRRAAILCSVALLFSIFLNLWVPITHWYRLVIAAIVWGSFLICIGIFVMPNLELWKLRLIRMATSWKT